MQRWTVPLMMALLALSLFDAFVTQDIRSSPVADASNLPWGLILRYAAAMAAGGALAGLLFRRRFGRPGISGWVQAFLFGAIAATFAGLLGSAFGLMPDLMADGFSPADAIKIGFGLLILPLSIIEAPWLGLVVVGVIAITHLLCRRKATA